MGSLRPAYMASMFRWHWLCRCCTGSEPDDLDIDQDLEPIRLSPGRLPLSVMPSAGLQRLDHIPRLDYPSSLISKPFQEPVVSLQQPGQQACPDISSTASACVPLCNSNSPTGGSIGLTPQHELPEHWQHGDKWGFENCTSRSVSKSDRPSQSVRSLHATCGTAVGLYSAICPLDVPGPTLSLAASTADHAIKELESCNASHAGENVSSSAACCFAAAAEEGQNKDDCLKRSRAPRNCVDHITLPYLEDGGFFNMPLQVRLFQNIFH